jgi:para-aminobenzoate synthetase component 1
LKLIELPYFADTWVYLGALKTASGLVWHHEGKTSISNEWVSAWPEKEFSYHGQHMTTIKNVDKSSSKERGRFFDIIRSHTPTLEKYADINFSGGLAGHLSYDYGLELLDIVSRHEATQMPLATVGLYSWSLNINHQSKTARIYIQPFCSESVKRSIVAFKKQLNGLVTKNKTSVQDWVCKTHKQEYEQSFNRLKNYIVEGDCYQVNLTRQWHTEVLQGDDLALYQRLVSSMPAPFSVFHRTESHSLLSVSPERFIKINQSDIITQPIKGTRARSDDTTIDQQRIRELSNSEKDRAENLMIVDLLRNDIAKNAVPGSVKVDKLFELQSFKNVHHLVSTVSSKLLEERDALDVLEDAFPGGSITGAPKKRAMEIIDELEACRRGNYCGCSFYLGAENEFDSNILIRSMTLHNNRLTCSGGGGIVFDSEMESEYDESDVKVRRLLSALA